MLYLQYNNPGLDPRLMVALYPVVVTTVCGRASHVDYFGLLVARL